MIYNEFTLVLLLVLYGVGKAQTSMDGLVVKPIVVDGKRLDPKLETHQTGWNLSVRSPFSGKLLLVREDGKFIAVD